MDPLSLRRLDEMHPKITAVHASRYAELVGHGMARHRHRAGVRLDVTLEGTAFDVGLEFDPPVGDIDTEDTNEVTEKTAEAVALALVRTRRDWVVRRRMQRGESADWLLEDPDGRRVALEVSGVMTGSISGRSRRKTAQAARAVADIRVACVVGTETPNAVVTRVVP
jgi:hypothetical protein